jgi:hypothetical protein
MSDAHGNERLTAIEIGHLWNAYMHESLVHHIIICFAAHIHDKDLAELATQWRDMTKRSLDILINLFQQEKLPIPRGITFDDIYPDAPRLFSDRFYMIYAVNMARFALQSYAMAYVQSSRKDIRETFEHYINRLTLINKQAVDLALTKGVYAYPPPISAPHSIDFVHDKSFFSGLFGNKRPLTSLEITHMFVNAEFNAVGKTFITGFAQVTKTEEIRRYFLRGKAIAEKLFSSFSDVLLQDGVSVPSSYDSEIIRTSESPFSDRFMLFHINLLNTAGFGSYGTALGVSPRLDLGWLYVKVLLQVGLYAKSGANLMVKNGWLEQPPSPQYPEDRREGGKRGAMSPAPAMKPLDRRQDGQDE